ncbi:MAG: cellulase family glycosylhydrolase [Lachnospiraceae bacterium]
MDEEDINIYRSKVKIFFVGVVVGALIAVTIIGICGLITRSSDDSSASSEHTKESFIFPSVDESSSSNVTEAAGSNYETDSTGEVLQAGNPDFKPSSEVNGTAGSGYRVESGTPVANHGRLKVVGTNLVDKNNNVFQLRGVSTHGLHWFPQYVNRETFKEFRDEWKCNVIRLAMYTGEGGYCSGSNQTSLKALIADGVTYATELGMYVIIDWHSLNDDRNPNTFKAQALAFWDEMSRTYKDYENVIYEICNEPNSTSWAEVKSYATDVIARIRKNDPNAVILVGTPQWCQLPQQAAADSIADDKNVMYTVHFYAATHGDDIRNNVVAAHEAGLPMFVSECSICDASGSGGCNYDSAGKWVNLLDSYGISYVAWNISNKGESSALIRGDKYSGWSDSELSDTGKWFKKIFSGSGTSGGTSTVTPTQPKPTQPATQAPTQPPKQKVEIEIPMRYSVSIGGQWGTDEEYTRQYIFTVENLSGAISNNWTITIPDMSGYTMIGGWCCEREIVGDKLIIKPESFNGAINPYSSVTNIAVTLTGRKDKELATGSIVGTGFVEK